MTISRHLAATGLVYARNNAVLADQRVTARFSLSFLLASHPTNLLPLATHSLSLNFTRASLYAIVRILIGS